MQGRNLFVGPADIGFMAKVGIGTAVVSASVKMRSEALGAV